MGDSRVLSYILKLSLPKDSMPSIHAMVVNATCQRRGVYCWFHNSKILNYNKSRSKFIVLCESSDFSLTKLGIVIFIVQKHHWSVSQGITWVLSSNFGFFFDKFYKQKLSNSFKGSSEFWRYLQPKISVMNKHCVSFQNIWKTFV